MATTYYMALFLDALLQLCKHEIIISANVETDYSPEKVLRLPVLDGLEAMGHERFSTLLGRFDFESQLASETPNHGD